MCDQCEASEVIDSLCPCQHYLEEASDAPSGDSDLNAVEKYISPEVRDPAMDLLRVFKDEIVQTRKDLACTLASLGPAKEGRSMMETTATLHTSPRGPRRPSKISRSGLGSLKGS